MVNRAEADVSTNVPDHERVGQDATQFLITEVPVIELQSMCTIIRPRESVAVDFTRLYAARRCLSSSVTPKSVWN